MTVKSSKAKDWYGCPVAGTGEADAGGAECPLEAGVAPAPPHAPATIAATANAAAARAVIPVPRIPNPLPSRRLE
jgi:hypothetical protein